MLSDLLSVVVDGEKPRCLPSFQKISPGQALVTKSTERRLNRSSWTERATVSQVQNILRLDFEISNSITGFATSMQCAVGVLPQKCRSIIQQSERSRSQHPGNCQYTACTLLTIPCWQGCTLWTVAFAPPSCEEHVVRNGEVRHGQQGLHVQLS